MTREKQFIDKLHSTRTSGERAADPKQSIGLLIDNNLYDKNRSVAIWSDWLTFSYARGQ